MQITVRPLALTLETPFKLSYGATTVRENVLVQVDDGTFTGVGEAAVVPYTGETPARVSAYLNDPAVEAALGENALWLEDALDRLPPGESSAARAALDMALHDLWGQHLGQPLYRLWGLNPARSPRSSSGVSPSGHSRGISAATALASSRMNALRRASVSDSWRIDCMMSSASPIGQLFPWLFLSCFHRPS